MAENPYKPTELPSGQEPPQRICHPVIGFAGVGLLLALLTAEPTFYGGFAQPLTPVLWIVSGAVLGLVVHLRK